ncbi:MAG: hypothetical protein BWZ01_02718 [Deltaproteobacteria bacterium ADurb.BinA179]|nr:MAG: hypothetical protein BWZ01_02718 [Deltaproteobacteria bacterium ADurb.BinA179]
MELGHVGDEGIGHRDVAVHDGVLGGRVGQRPQRFHIGGDFGQLAAYMADLVQSVVFCHGHGAARCGLHQGDLVADRREPVEGREGIGQEHGVLPLAAHEDALPGDKDVVEDDHGLCQGPDGCVRMELMIGPGAPASAADKGHSLGVGRHSEAHGVLTFVLAHLPGGDDHDLVDDGRARYVRLGPFDNDAVLVLVHHVNIVVRMLLVRRLFGSVALDAGDRSAGEEVVFP